MSGLVVMRYHHARPVGDRSRVDRALLRRVTVVPVPDGAGGLGLALGTSF